MAYGGPKTQDGAPGCKEAPLLGSNLLQNALKAFKNSIKSHKNINFEVISK